MKRFSRIAKYIFPLLFLSTCFSIGFGSWSLSSEKSYTNLEIGKQTKEPVAYIKNSSGNTYYMTLEKAIEVANNAKTATDVWVIPGTTYTLEAEKLTTVTINSNVTLQLPFYKEKVFDVWKTGTTQNSKGQDISDGIWDPDDEKKQDEWPSSVCALDQPSKFLKTQITLGNNIQLVNKGTINIGGVIGGMGGGTSGTPCGQTCHYYSEILCTGLKIDSSEEKTELSPQISNYGTIKNHGSINSSDSSIVKVENNSGSILKTVLIMGENRGGTALIKLGGGYDKALMNKLNFESSPFNTIYATNIKARMKTNHGSSIYGLAAMYGDSSHNQVEINIYGNDNTYLFQSKEGYLVTQSFKKYTNKDAVLLDFFGSHAINYIKMSIKAPIINTMIDVKTNTVFFPLSYANEVSFNSLNDDTSAVIDCTQDTKILPGGKLSIGKNVTFNIGQLAVYDSSFRDPLTDGVTYPVLKENGILELSGSIKAKNFGGYASLKKEKASLNITGSASVSSKQIIGNPANTQYEDFLFNASSTVSSNGGGDLFSGTLVDAKEYSSLSTNSGEFYFAVNEVKHSVKIHCCGKFNREIKNWLGIVKSYEYVYPTYDFIGPDGSKISSASQNSSTITTDTDTKKTMIPYNFHVILKHGDTIKISNLKNGTMSANVAFNDNSFIVDEDIYIVINYKN